MEDELVWDFTTGDVIDPKTGEVVDRILLVYPTMSFSSANIDRESDASKRIHYAVLRQHGQDANSKRRSRSEVIYLVVRNQIDKELDELCTRAEALIGELAIRACEVYRRLREREFSWFINGVYVGTIRMRLAILAYIIAKRSCLRISKSRIARAFSIPVASFNKALRKVRIQELT